MCFFSIINQPWDNVVLLLLISTYYTYSTLSGRLIPCELIPLLA